uniref:Hypotheticial protein n=1 Tax=Schistosoma japonicum TaxID=6182 RepID=C1LJJ0_SCHJA|nr:hypotheticial protein [Schistosoma japonicum]
MKYFFNCLPVFGVVQIFVNLPNCTGWSITCNETMCCENDTTDKLCCQGNSCTFLSRASGSGNEISELYRRKVRMDNYLKLACAKIQT